MSTSYRVYVVVGVPADRFVTVRKEKSSVTKYNPDTGVPYQIEVVKQTVCGFDVPMTDLDGRDTHPDSVLYALGESKPEGIGSYSAGGYEDDQLKNAVVGVRIKKLEPAGRPYLLDRDELDRTVEAVAQKLAKIGYKPEKHGPVGTYVIHYVG